MSRDASCTAVEGGSWTVSDSSAACSGCSGEMDWTRAWFALFSSTCGSEMISSLSALHRTISSSRTSVSYTGHGGTVRSSATVKSISS